MLIGTCGSITFTDPYKVIKEVFSFADIGFYRNFIRDILRFSSSRKKYNKEDAGYILLLLEGLNCLLQACFIISKEKKHSHLELGEEDILNRHFYYHHEIESKIWSDFPRVLTKKELLDPYLVFGKVYAHKYPGEWYGIVKGLVEDACGSYDDVPQQNTMWIYTQLVKLFEASHLIYVRELVQERCRCDQ